jgi:hypothetical protein
MRQERAVSNTKHTDSSLPAVSVAGKDVEPSAAINEIVSCHSADYAVVVSSSSQGKSEVGFG